MFKSTAIKLSMGHAARPIVSHVEFSPIHAKIQNVGHKKTFPNFENL